MWNPIRDKEHDARQLIAYYASKGIQKELDKINKKIKKSSDTLLACDYNNSTMKKRQRLRTQLSLECEQRDRLELAIQLCKELNQCQTN